MFKLHKTVLPMSSRGKRCSSCTKLYRRAAFDGHVREHDGLQPFCRGCDWDAKRKPHRRWRALLQQAKSRGLRVEMTEPEYLTILRGGLCHWCRWPPFVWGGGCMDRLEVAGHYLMSNCVLCCAPCNRYRNNLPVDIWSPMIAALVARNGPGPLRHVMPPARPDMSRFEIQDPQLLLPGTA